MKARQARDQPRHREGGVRTHLELLALRPARQALRRVTHGVDGLRHRAKVVRALARQRYLLVPAMQQANAEEVLERADLAADRARRHVQLVRRERDAHVPRGRLEGAHGIQWGKSIHAGHATHA